MKNCEHCNKPITSKWTTKKTRFCSGRCSNLQRAAGGEFYKRHSLLLKDRATKPPSRKGKKAKRERVSVRLSWREKVFRRLFDELGFDYKRKRVIIEQDEKCGICGIDEWQNQKIPLEVDHMDGNRHNHVRKNMRALCPNCHATTDNYRGRNARRGSFPPNNVFYEKYKEVGNIRQVLIAFNLAPKGGNYQKAKWIIQDQDCDAKIETVLTYNSPVR